ncbi:LOW QUALITY PROTEIN: speckle targeted PIP5K1A-regulated poly(A) polymerase [Falco rusticolus]|uniref:LOW QUALITY PROTEIN: speckle targeted PIP5K1A-regulated poly(A) polymerase n=1 Tax=Falco rusticolus TaxID=120794 RepID=UPI0018869901|nr:LOW QUALITY PROTEIN: speckle targeted PIP5K1A-regulated poly(A) polymerase [Falco rusticolus]
MDAGTEPVPEPDLDPAADPDVEPLPRGGFRCRLCQVSAANRPSLADHLRGKKHRRLRELRAERRAQEQRSLFVSGFARGTSGPELARYFGAFGDVATVVMDKEKGAYAIVELQDAAGRERALAEPQHSLAGHRLRVRPREQKGFAYGPPGRSPQREPPGAGQLEQALCQASDVDAQLAQLVAMLELSEDEQRLRHLLVTLFQEVFTEFFPGCSIVPFGSSVNGFATRGCDLDLLLDLEPTKSLQAATPDAPTGSSTNTGTSSSTSSGSCTGSGTGSSSGTGTDTGSSTGTDTTFCTGTDTGSSTGTDTSSGTSSGADDSILSDVDLAATPLPEVLELVAAVLRRCVPGVRRVRAVPTARRPVVKFCHKQSGLAGDISIDNRLALLNTRFLLLCAQADARVRPLVYAVRLWAKQQGLAGNRAGGGPLLNNYALTLLVLFFLQTRSPPVLPTVAQLRDLAGDQDRTVVAGWDCTFPQDAASLAPSTNTETPCSLLAEFFHFFGDFDFPARLISLREGRALPLPPPPTPPQTPQGLKLGPLNLQDPFELSHNVAANVTPKTATRLGRCCRDAAKYCRSLQYRQKSTKGRPWGLVRLFQPGAVGPGSGNPPVFSIPIPVDSPGRSPGEVGAAVALVLRDVLKCSCAAGKPPRDPGEGEEIPEGSPDPPAVGSKRRRPDEPTGGKIPRVEEEAKWSCAVWHRVWTGRRRVRRRLQHRVDPVGSTETAVELEREVSEAIVIQEGSGQPAEPLIQFDASACPAGTQRVLLRLLPSPTTPSPLFREFFQFLRSFLPHAVRQRLRPDPPDQGFSTF